MTGDPIFGDQSRDQGVGVAVKETVMPDAQANHNVELCTLPIEALGLEDRIAHVFSHRVAGRIDPHRGFVHRPGLAGDAEYRKAVRTEDPGQSAAFPDQAHAGGDPKLAKTHAAGKIHNFLYAGELTVPFKFHLCRGQHDLAVPILVVEGQRLFQFPLFQGGGKAEFWVLMFLCAAIDHAAVNTGAADRIMLLHGHTLQSTC